MDEEQQQEQQQTETAPGAATRDDLIAAVREAGGTASIDVEAEERAAAERAAAAGATATEPAPETQPEEEEPRIARLLKEREKGLAEREAARNLAQETIEQARREAERMIAEARERADREWQAELERRRRAFDENPTEQARVISGGDPQRLVDAVLRDGTPEGRALREMQRQLQEAQQQAQQGATAKQEIAQLREDLQRQRHEELIANVRTKFLGEHATPEKAPHLHARYDQDEIFHRADQLAARWQREGMKLGVDFDFDDVTQYLEVESKKRLAPLVGSTPARQVSAGAAAGQPGNAPKVSANAPRALSAATGSERRTSPKPLSEMKPEEQRAALIEEVAAARRANPDAVF